MRFHTNLPVTNVENTVRFYSTLLGTEPVKVKNDYAKFLLDDGGLNLSFHQSESGSSELKSLHLGFEMPDQMSLDEAFTRLEAAGLVSAKRQTSICCYANQDKFWVKDPDGYEWEIYLLLEDTEQKIEESTGCCGGAAARGGAAACGAESSPAGGACC